MKKKISASIFLSSLISVLLVAAVIFAVMYAQFYKNMKSLVRDEANLLIAGYSLIGTEYLDGIPEACRVTVISPDGTVIFDNYAAPSEMENHAGRPEVLAAFAQGEGEATRMSTTVGEQTFYYASLLEDGSVLRAAKTVDSVYASLLACLPFVLLAVAAAGLLSVAVANRRTKKIIRPINELDLDRPLANNEYDELSPLLTRIEKQHRQIAEQLAALEKKQDEFSAITESMNEGLILLNNTGTILSINKSASRLFGAGEVFIGRDILTIQRSTAVQELIKAALGGARSETVLELAGREYQFVASPVSDPAGNITGIVLLTFDITERSRSEQMRREFTANVSHELKTPLHSIMGSAELLKNGMVKREDVPGFVDRIYSEAQRLVALIDDIIRLSRLDEQRGVIPRERMDLTDVVGEVAEKLRDQAAGHGVELTVTGDAAYIDGNRGLVFEIVFNLCDNAIKYNREGGRVDMSVSSDAERVTLTVADTGVGIPKEHLGRIFERFYRVDKSHSKETGGTGLGLSIVKHAAQLHEADIEVASREGRGTTVKVRFAKP